MKLSKIIMLLIVIQFVSSCSKDDKKIPLREYGIMGSHHTKIYTAPNNAFTSIIYPEDLESMDEKSPIVFFISGWFGDSKSYEKYGTLMKFVASHGYTAVYTDEWATTDYKPCIKSLEDILDDPTIKTSIKDHLDFSKIGVMGHSVGGGLVFTAMDRLSKKGYGENGRFVLALDPWFAFGMTETDMNTLPSNTNVLILKFGEGGNNATDGTDARIPLTEYYLLNSIADTQKDYSIYVNADHHYPYGNTVEELQGIVKPLDALMDYSFDNKSEEIRKIALENGNDDPYANGNGIQVILPQYEYPCDGGNTLINYCKITQ